MKLQRYERDYVQEQYETLRREALEAAPFGPRGAGLAVFETQGMLRWLTVLTALAPQPAPKPSQHGGPQLLGSARPELTTVLSSMVLACTEPGRDFDAQHQ